MFVKDGHRKVFPGYTVHLLITGIKTCTPILLPFFHYAIMPIQYAAIFKVCKNDKFWLKKIHIFNFAKITSGHNLCFRAK